MSVMHVDISRADLESKRAFWIEIAKENGWHQPGHFGITAWVKPDGSIYDALYQPPGSRHFDTVIVIDDVNDDDYLAVIHLHDDRIVLSIPEVSA